MKFNVLLIKSFILSNPSFFFFNHFSQKFLPSKILTVQFEASYSGGGVLGVRFGMGGNKLVMCTS